MIPIVLLRGGGDLATGVALRLHRGGVRVVITELPEPLALRRTVCFCEAVYEGFINIEGTTARAVEPHQVEEFLSQNGIPVLIDPDLERLPALPIQVLVDGRMLKDSPGPLREDLPLHIGLGPGFHPGRNCHAAIETRRSHTLGRVHWEGPVQADSGLPDGDPRRVLRAPADGTLTALARIADHLESGEPVAEIAGQIVSAPFPGVLRGLIRPGILVRRGLKIGDMDARDDPALCSLVSDKSLAVGGGVLEAILTKPGIRAALWKS